MAGIVSTRLTPSVIAHARGPRAPIARDGESSGDSPPPKPDESSATNGEALCRGRGTSGLSASVVQRISERGARMARRDDREYREYLPGVATQPAGMPRPKVAVQMTRTGH